MTDNRSEVLAGSRKPILVEGQTPTEKIDDATAVPALSTADVARAGEQHKPDEARRSDSSRDVPVRTAGTATAGDTREDSTPLFSSDEAGQLRSRWDNIQVGFVDEPRHAVEQADELVASTVKRLAQVFADERTTLEQQWSRGDQVSTEDLRLALQRYRSFFSRLLSV